MELLNERLSSGELAELVGALDVLRLPSTNNVKELPDSSAVYFLLCAGRVEYVGESYRLRSRWRCHNLRDALRPHNRRRVAHILVPDDKRLRLDIERAFVQRLRPERLF